MQSIAVLLVFFAAYAVSLEENAGRHASFLAIQNRIAGGEFAEVGQFPHQVGVQTHRLSEAKFDYTTFCGGSLISDEFVLTAAHCLHDGIYTEVFLGATNFTGAWIRMKIEKENMIIHEKYDVENIRNDIALVKLPQKAPFSALPGLIKTINLPRLSQKQMSFDNSVGWILGWGRIGDGEKGIASNHLRFARRWILPPSFCSYYYPRPPFDGNTQMCVDGSHGISACPGDSGGPVFIEEDDGSRTVVGVASYERIEGCEKHFPVAYTRVTVYLDWIVEKTGITLRK